MPPPDRGCSINSYKTLYLLQYIISRVVFLDEYFINPKLAHLVHNIFWSLGFKLEKWCYKVHRSMIYVFRLYFADHRIIICCKHAVLPQVLFQLISKAHKPGEAGGVRQSLGVGPHSGQIWSRLLKNGQI